MEQDYLTVLKIDNVLVMLTILIGLLAHACSATHAFLPFLKQLFIERVGELIGKRPWSFVRDGVLLGPLELRSQLISLFEQATEYKDTKAWMEHMIRYLVNLIYGDQVLHQ